ncbi:hypothetical protein KPZU09_09240 [Klebsiella pneumoniae]|uniref:Oxidoreductase n=1 Tax=Klebsiella pneumoniae TaxID=573 RepID=A0A919HPM9_KLEPN|nr:hypothetical protein KPZU09_09240 [Klebsiella pneumoniae]
MSDAIRVGLVGFGYASKTFHAPLIGGTPGMALKAVASSDADKVHADWPGVKVMSAPGDLLDDPDIDLVVIATPNDTHFPLAKAALEAGKHVVVDKPFTVTLSQARELESLAKHCGRILSVFHNRRWDSDFLTVSALINEGQLGEVCYFKSHFDRFRPQVRQRWREQAGPGSGIWYDLAPHLLDRRGAVWPAGKHHGGPRAASARRAIHRLFSRRAGLSAAAGSTAWYVTRRRGERALYRSRLAGQLY